MQIIRAGEHKKALWPGGTTTQLCIYPPGADYARRDFLFRLSTATIDTFESTFTSLPGFTRQLMILEGELLIKHGGQYEKRLQRFDKDEFDGSWQTTAIGKVTDFNLMLSPAAKGDLYHHFLEEGKTFRPDFRSFAYVYVLEGGLRVDDLNDTAGAKDLIVLKNGGSPLLLAEGDTHLVVADVQLTD